MTANGGLITKEDLAAYEAKERAPVRGTYPRLRDHLDAAAELRRRRARSRCSTSSRRFDLKAKGRDVGRGAAPEIEAMRRAYLDRARYLGDPDFVKVPVATLTLEGARARRWPRRSIRRRRSSSVELGKDIVTAPPAQEPDETTHFSVIDRNGMAVSQHLHARRRLRLARRRQGRRLPAQQRDGRLQQEARRDRRRRQHRHAGRT